MYLIDRAFLLSAIAPKLMWSGNKKHSTIMFNHQLFQSGQRIGCAMFTFLSVPEYLILLSAAEFVT